MFLKFIYLYIISETLLNAKAKHDIKNETLWLQLLLSDTSFTHHCWLLSEQITVGHLKCMILVSVHELKVCKKFLYLVHTLFQSTQL